MAFFGNRNSRDVSVQQPRVADSNHCVNSTHNAQKVRRDGWGLKEVEGDNIETVPVEVRQKLYSTRSSTDTIIPRSNLTSADLWSTEPIYPKSNLSPEARISFVRRLILDIFIYTYAVPITTLERLTNEIWYPSTHSTHSLLTIVENEFAMYLAHLALAGLNLATTEDVAIDDNRLSSPQNCAVYTHIVQPCNSLDVSPETVFDLLQAIPRHTFSPTYRYKTLPHQHAAVLMHLEKHNHANFQQRYKLSKCLLSDAAVLVKVAESLEMWTAVGACIRIFGGKYMGRGWEEQVAEEDRNVVVSQQAKDLGVEVKLWNTRQRFESVDAEKEEAKESDVNEYIISHHPTSSHGKKKKNVHFEDEDDAGQRLVEGTKPEEHTRQQELAVSLEENVEPVNSLGIMERNHVAECAALQDGHALKQISTREDRIHAYLQGPDSEVVEYRAIVADMREQVGL